MDELTWKEYKEEARKSLYGEYLTNNDILTNEKIYDTKLYKYLVKMPKGSDLHLHGLTLLPALELFDFVCSEKDLAINVSNGDERGFIKNKCELKDEEKENYMEILKASQENILSKEEFLKLQSFYKFDDSESKWSYFGKILDRQLGIETDFNVLERYYDKAFLYYANNNISHIEMKIVPLGSEEQAKEKAKTIMRAYHNVRKDYPDFSVKVFVCGLKLKFLDMGLNDIIMNNAKAIYDNVKDDEENFMVGIDFVNEEDESRDLSEFEKYIVDARERMPETVFAPHAGESLKLDDSNLRYAVNNNARRIGHGFSLYRFNDLENDVKDKGITLEICPLSNQILDYAKDLRLHPVKKYIEDDLSVVIASDDPGFFEHTSLVDDYFALVLELDLSFEDVKKLVLNSVNKAIMNDSKKESLIKKINEEFETI